MASARPTPVGRAPNTCSIQRPRPVFSITIPVWKIGPDQLDPLCEREPPGPVLEGRAHHAERTVVRVFERVGYMPVEWNEAMPQVPHRRPATPIASPYENVRLLSGAHRAHVLSGASGTSFRSQRA
jgi:hypothetical protein